MNKKAQGSLEYLIIIAAVLAIVAIIVLFVTGSFGASKSSADISKCKAAASRCDNEHATSSTAPCTYCETACPEPLWNKCKQGDAKAISSIECKIDTDCKTRECNTVSCNEGYCDYEPVNNGTSCSVGRICCSGSCFNATPSCDDGNSCTDDSLVNEDTCEPKCINNPITDCKNDDGCCPAGCNVNNDKDCPIRNVNGWVVSNGELWNSLNGAPWSPNLTSSETLTSVDFLNETNGVVLGFKSSFYSTNNAGKTWDDASETNNVDALSVKLLNKNLGLLVGKANIAGYTFWAIKQITSTSLTSNLAPYGQNTVLYDVDIIDSNNALAVGKNLSNSKGLIVWVDPTKNNNGISLSYKIKKITENQLFTIEFVNKTKGFAGGQGLLLKTVDAGETWESINTISGYETSNFWFNDIFFINESNGWLVSNNRIFRTTDSGETWAQPRTRPGDGGTYTKIYFINSSNGWVGTTKGRLFKTTNGGDSWTYDGMNTGQKISDIKFTIS